VRADSSHVSRVGTQDGYALAFDLVFRELRPAREAATADPRDPAPQRALRHLDRGSVWAGRGHVASYRVFPGRDNLRTHQLWTVLVLFGFLSLPTSSAWAQGGTAIKDEPVNAEPSLWAPRGFDTARWLQSRGSTSTNGLTMELTEALPAALDFIERNGDLRAIRQMQPTKLKKISRTKAIIIAAVAVTVAIIVFLERGLKGGGCAICAR
jgi:hypothetical protein